ncbi:TPA: WD40 repeat domain-containing protein, partial [Candidatus Micrarchaeota archaeon]|nr:WD40 repeat domain-containing protein [Candidatus Micrarchaeota archaeon]
GDIVAKFPWNRWGIVSVAFSPDGRLIAIGANDSVIRVWDLGERRLLVNLTSPVGPPRILTFAERDLLAVGTFGTVARWSVPDWSPGAPIDLGIDTSRSSLSGKILVSYPKRGPVVVVDFASGEILGRLGEGRYLGRITATEFSPDGDLLALGTDAGTIHLFDPSWKEAFLAEGPAGAVDSLSFSPNGGRYLIAASGGRVWIWEVGEGEAKLLRQFLAHTKPISEVDFSPEGDRFLTASWDETVRVWDLEGKLLLSLWKAARVEALQPLIRDATFAAAFSPRGDLIASGHEDKTVRLWELQGKRLHILKKHWGVVWCVAFSPDGKILASGGEGGMVVLWDV